MVPVLDGGAVDVETVGDLVEGESAAGAPPFGVTGKVMSAA